MIFQRKLILKNISNFLFQYLFKQQSLLNTYLVHKLLLKIILQWDLLENAFFKSKQNVFVQLSLAFRNDSYTLESRIHQAERERNLTEENAEKELENFKAAITVRKQREFFSWTIVYIKVHTHCKYVGLL